MLPVLLNTGLFAQVQVLDDFEGTQGWSFIRSDAVELHISNERGMNGHAVRFDYDFTRGTGYGGIQKVFPISLPDNYEFTFYLKAESPSNNFEIKFLDSTGNNVWWVNNRNFSFPGEWKKIRIKKRHIQFAWGPAEDHTLHRVDRIEFTVASFVGGRGSLWLDHLTFEPLPPERTHYPSPLITASTFMKGHEPGALMDDSPVSYWQSRGLKEQSLRLDFTTRREFGGLEIQWQKGLHAKNFEVFLSDNGNDWEKAYVVNSNNSAASFIRLPEAEARYVRLDFREGASAAGIGIRDLRIPDSRSTQSMNDFLIYAAEHSPPGDYPRYCSRQASYWTVTGVNNDIKEALINEDGMVEIEKARFSMEPVIRIGDSLYAWNNVKTKQSLGSRGDAREMAFIPDVQWQCGGLKFATAVMATGEANKNSRTEVGYSFENLSDQAREAEFYILIRPFQVNPYYQFLNLQGGAGKISRIREMKDHTVEVDDHVLIFPSPYDSFGACGFDEGNPVECIREGRMPAGNDARDPLGLATGIVKYSVHLGPREGLQFMVVAPLYGRTAEPPLNPFSLTEDYNNTSAFWDDKTSYVRFNLPPSADAIIDTYRANLAYILINRDKAGIQPGSRSYERSWIRDGALTSSALLKSGIVTEVKDFIEWYADHQYENGKVPCVVDSRGPDPVPENDSHGEFIYLIREYFNFTKDSAFLRSMNSKVLNAVNYIEGLVAERSTVHYKYGNDSVHACYGLVPESISHEGYSAKPMHSYWDDFFTLKGLKDAADIQLILGEKENYEKVSSLRDTFRVNLYHSLQLAMKTRNIDYIPGCVELGDFDATSTTIALTPCNELNNLPKPQVYRTFDRYYDFFRGRRDGTMDWVNYTPYENRLIGSFILLDQPERAHELISFFLNDQRPGGWHHWAEVVWKDYRSPRYIGDMPHTWVGSDFINAIRALFVYENEYDQSLVVAAALYQDWIDCPAGMSVENLPTYYGDLSYAVNKEGNAYRFTLSGSLSLPANGITIRNFNGSRLPARVTINGRECQEFNEKEITVRVFPATVMIYY